MAVPPRPGPNPSPCSQRIPALSLLPVDNEYHLTTAMSLIYQHLGLLHGTKRGSIADMTMNRRTFLLSGAALALASRSRLHADSASLEHRFPPDIIKNEWYVESQPIPEYHWAPTSAYEAFRDMKFGIRLHWGIYSIWHRGPESWPFLNMSF